MPWEELASEKTININLAAVRPAEGPPVPEVQPLVRPDHRTRHQDLSLHHYCAGVSIGIRIYTGLVGIDGNLDSW